MDLWDVGTHLEKIRKSSRSMYDNTNMHHPLRTISCDVPLNSMSVANRLIIAGDIDGNVSVLDPSDKAAAGGRLQKFSNHKGTVTDIYAVSHHILLIPYLYILSRILLYSVLLILIIDMWHVHTPMQDSFRVLTCSKDFSIRVYRWTGRGSQAKAAAQLESKYTLLGGSIAHKTQ